MVTEHEWPMVWNKSPLWTMTGMETGLPKDALVFCSRTEKIIKHLGKIIIVVTTSELRNLESFHFQSRRELINTHAVYSTILSGCQLKCWQKSASVWLYRFQHLLIPWMLFLRFNGTITVYSVDFHSTTVSWMKVKILHYGTTSSLNLSVSGNRDLGQG